MRKIEHQIFDQERALYGSDGLLIRSCAFTGPADGESALKESRNIEAEDTLFNLRYPLWHDHNLIVRNSTMTEFCRAALWYSDNIEIEGTKIHGIKALRECRNVRITNCDIISPEFGWNCSSVEMKDSKAESEYFMMRSSNLHFSNVDFTGKYSFQYIENAVFEDCNFNTKDAFWHAKNVVVKNCTVRGEYLAWYCENVTFDNCTIIGTQPLCYCRGLKLIDCRMEEADLAFEKSEVEAVVLSEMISIKNPASGKISLPAVSQIIRDDKNSKAEIIVGGRKYTCA